MKKLVRINLIFYIAFVLFFCGFMRAEASSAEEENFWIEYVDVGQGDCAIVQCDNHTMIIDGGPSDTSSIVYSILKNKEINTIDIMVATHPDADHIGGLSGALSYAKVLSFLSPVKDDESKTFTKLVKNLQKQKKEVTVPANGDTFKLGSATVEILGPIYNSYEDNNLSIVVKIKYGSKVFLFMGDAEEDEENDIIKYSNSDITCDVIKIGHHGSNSSTTDDFLKKTKPKYAIISVGANDYGHPAKDVLNRLKIRKVAIYRTDLQGNIICYSDGNNIRFETEKNRSNNKETAKYVLNIRTQKIHLPSCVSAASMSSKNKIYTDETINQLISRGFEPCRYCRPK